MSLPAVREVSPLNFELFEAEPTLYRDIIRPGYQHYYMYMYSVTIIIHAVVNRMTKHNLGLATQKLELGQDNQIL